MPDRMVIAEIGGSSSRWAWCDGDAAPISFPLRGGSVLGFNPLNGDAAAFVGSVRTYLGEHAPEAFNANIVHAYAAGCGSEERQRTMKQTLQQLWPTAMVTVDTDLMGAARGLCGKEKGLVLIVGTGMNAGHYDPGVLYRPMPSLGWILGDEGSGADIGRCLLQDAFYHRMPEHVRLALFGVDGPSLDVVLNEVHRSPFPARSLAGYTGLLAAHKDEPYVRDLICSRFNALTELLVGFFPSEQRANVFATGSVAYGFRDLLSECLLDRGMTLKVVQPDPLPGLVHYHQAS